MKSSYEQVDLDELTGLIQGWSEKMELDLYRSELQDLAREILHSSWFAEVAGAAQFEQQVS